MKANIFITGFSATGKTSVGKEVALALKWEFIDLDEKIVAKTGESIDSIFSGKGENHFRSIESEVLREYAKGSNQVISTGGGIITTPENIQVMESHGFIICLEATVETVFKRLQDQDKSDSNIIRPLLDTPDPICKIRSLKNHRQSYYSRAHWTVHTDNMTQSQVASEILRGWQILSTSRSVRQHTNTEHLAAVVHTSSNNYPIWVGWGIIKTIGDRILNMMGPTTAYIITDTGVEHIASNISSILDANGIQNHIYSFPSGERSKNLKNVRNLYGWLAKLNAERGHLILAVGGGVVGDLAGYVAATYLRGIAFAQIPTSVLAMMDASIGGKVAVDLPEGKNLVGAFYQPQFVMSDVQTLISLPKRQVTSGWAEAIKHGMILDSTLLESFENDFHKINSLDPEVTTEVVRQSVSIKAHMVSLDERETLGIRILLNYGHTIGHAIESSTGYDKFLHGEAVSIGMMGAAYISNKKGLITTDQMKRQFEVLNLYGLPAFYPDIDIPATTLALRSDKKTSGKNIRWVLLKDIGSATTDNKISQSLVQEALTYISQKTI